MGVLDGTDPLAILRAAPAGLSAKEGARLIYGSENRANEAKANQAYVGQVVVNVRSNGSLVFNKNPISGEELLQKLNKLSKLFPDQAVIIRGDRRADYQHIVDVLDICRKANIWNIAFATVKQE